MSLEASRFPGISVSFPDFEPVPLTESLQTL
jgi:hypothetical protein